MRLDHLLSKENIVIVCFVAGWVLVSAWLVTSFLSPHVGFMCGGKVFRWETPCVCACVVCACGVLGSMEQRQGEAFSAGWPVGGVFGKRVCVLVCFVCMACCWVSRAARLLFY